MSTAEPRDPDEILKDLDFDVEEPDVTDLTTLNDWDLASKTNDIRNELINRGELSLYDSPGLSERGRELHAMFLACHLELKRRRAEKNKP